MSEFNLIQIPNTLFTGVKQPFEFGFSLGDEVLEETQDAGPMTIEELATEPEHKIILCKPIFNTDYKGECPICYEAMTMIDFAVTRCGHAYHTSCLLESILMSTEGGCAMCRRQLIPENAFIVDEEEDEDEEDEEDEDAEVNDDESVWTDVSDGEEMNEEEQFPEPMDSEQGNDATADGSVAIDQIMCTLDLETTERTVEVVNPSPSPSPSSWYAAWANENDLQEWSNRYNW